MIYVVVLFVLLAGSFVAQAFVPTIDWAFRSTLYVVHLVFFSGAVTVSYPVMLAMAFCAGFAWDALTIVDVPVAAGSVPMTAGSLSFGYSILLFGMTGSLMQGIRPLFRRGRWELPVLMAGLAMMTYLTLEYLLLNLMRGGFVFPEAVWYKILTMSLMTTMVAPLLFLTLYRLAKLTGYEIRYDGLKTKGNYA
ncbi:MAG: hypothetical protein P8J87_06345 [Verrucomicrobiales bacterium]|nr:hypothetical protein [Verrucomicrobiales bacterium]